MSSSPNTTQLYDDDEVPPDDYYEPDPPNNVMVVSQSQPSQETHPFDHLLNAIAATSNDVPTPNRLSVPAISPPKNFDVDFDSSLGFQIPQPEANLIDPGAAKEVNSPARKSLLASFDDQNDGRKRDGSNLIDANDQQKKKAKVRVYPFEKICMFLRTDAISKYMESMDKAEVTVANDIKSAFKFWENARQVSLSPFEKIQDLRISPQALAINDHRLLLEDFMELKPSDDVFCLISKSHPMIASKKSSMLSRS